jgi:acetyl-CoA C-acetyltransferase
MMNEVVIVSGARTPIASFQGPLSSISAPKLGAIAIKEALKRAGLSAEQVNEVIMGCVLPAGMGQAPARQAAIYAGLKPSTPCMTINKVCGSGLKAVMLAAQAIRCGDAEVVVAGGMENMTQAPYLLPTAREGMRMGHQQAIDSLVHDGLWDPYKNVHMGNIAEICAKSCELSREAQDAFATQSYQKSLKAQQQGIFDEEIVAVEIPQKKGDPLVFKADEEPSKGNPSKFSALRPSFEKDGTITAANASSINDGAAALVLVSAAYAQKHNLPILAKLSGYEQHAQEPDWFTTAPAYAIQKLLDKKALTPEDIDLYEINEAFSVVSLAVNQIAKIPADRVNIYGGAVSLGHPIGASGARILVTLLYAMKRENAKRGVASLCIGGGEAVAVMVER